MFVQLSCANTPHTHRQAEVFLQFSCTLCSVTNYHVFEQVASDLSGCSALSHHEEEGDGGPQLGVAFLQLFKRAARVTTYATIALLVRMPGRCASCMPRNAQCCETQTGFRCRGQIAWRQCFCGIIPQIKLLSSVIEKSVPRSVGRSATAMTKY